MSLEMVPFKASDASNLISFTDLGALVGKHFKVVQGFMDEVHGGIPTYIVEKNDRLKSGFGKFKSRLDTYQALPVLREAEDKTQCVLRIFGTRSNVSKGPQRRRKIPIQSILLIATLITVSISGYLLSGLWLDSVGQPNSLPMLLLMTAEYAASLMAILAVHELGHVIATKLHYVKSSLPYFIPAPPYLGPGLYTPGTFGAVILQSGSPVNRDQLFDLGIAGPLSGFFVALIVTFIGVSLSVPMYAAPGGFFSYPPPLLFIMINLFPGWFPAGTAIALHPIAQAGYLGLIITCLNLFPSSQLDGGHMSRAAFGARGYQRASILSLLILIFLGTIPPYTFLPFAILLFFFSIGGTHPGPLDDVSKITIGRKILLIIGFIVLLLSLPMDYLRILPSF
jgi:membrane-associated protease RseP (regulator of RpoE activity)